MLWAIIMAGGQGIRLWPASRRGNPKQFLKLFGNKTLIENTVERVAKVVPNKRIYIITEAPHVQRTRKLFPAIPACQIIGEPSPRNTAATIALGAALVEKRDREGVIAVFPSDHIILNHAGFKRSVLRAGSWAARGKHHVLFGVKPTYPSTAYGYVEKRSARAVPGIFKVNRFIEKPNREKAVQLCGSGSFFWQAGIFVWRVDTILEALKKHLTRHSRSIAKITDAWKPRQLNFSLPQLFNKIPNVSIDYGVMERVSNVYVVPAEFDWNDVGSWNALESVWLKDSDGNAYLGRMLSFHSKKNLAFSPSRLTCLLGVQDLVVVNTEDVTLVASKHDAEEVREMVRLLKERKINRHL